MKATDTPTVVVVTCLTDVTSDLVIDALNERGARIVRIDPADALIGEVEFSAGIGSAARWHGHLATSTRRVDLAEITAVYYRRPSPWRSRYPTAQAAEFATTEARHGLGGLLYTLSHAAYINHPAAASHAEYKPGQLQTAARLGFTVPSTLITNDPAEAQKFAAEYAPVVYKPMRGLPPTDDGLTGAIWTQRVEDTTIDGSIAATAHMLQSEVAKTTDARVTVVGNHVFASTVTATNGNLDWRRTEWEHLSCEPVTVPAPVTTRLYAYLEAYNLVFGCFDFALTGSGDAPEDWVWLECNPNGQWGFLPNFTDIAAAFAGVLTEPTLRNLP